MSDKAEELIRQILEKTEQGKLLWHFDPPTPSGEPWTEDESYHADLVEPGYSFSIRRQASGDNKVLSFVLNQPGRVYTAQADNFPLNVSPIGPITRKLLEIRRRSRLSDDKENLVESVDQPKIARFRLFSDLFYAARKSALAEDKTIEKVQQLLERLG
jgi:hypothetical protein